MVTMKKYSLILVLSFFLFACNEQVEKEQWNLVMTQPAQIWEECFPLGNGHLGMMPDGGIEKETFVLNDITLWSGAPSDDSNPLALESLPEIQRLLTVSHCSLSIGVSLSWHTSVLSASNFFLLLSAHF